NVELVIEANKGLNESMVNQVRFVETNDGSNPAMGRADQISVDQMRLEVRLDEGHDDDDLVNVGDDDVLSAARGASQETMSRLDALDQAFANNPALSWGERAGCGRRGPDPNTVASRDDISLVGGETAKQPADGTAEEPAVIGFHDAEKAVHPHHPARQTSADIDGGHLGRFGASTGRLTFLLNNRPSARQVAFSSNLLSAGCVMFVRATFLEGPCPVPRPRRLGAVLAQIDANLFLLGHANDDECITGRMPNSIKRRHYPLRFFLKHRHEIELYLAPR